MSMFENYEKDTYTAYNLTPPRIDKLISKNLDSPIYSVDTHGNIERLYWVEGEKFNLPVHCCSYINVPEDSIIISQHEEVPGNNHATHIGQKAYNIVDIVSFTCNSIDDESHWVKDNKFEFLSRGGKRIKLLPYMGNKTLKVQILNFRRELLYELSEEETLDILVPIDETLKQGQYFIDIFTVDEEEFCKFCKEIPISILGDLDGIDFTEKTGIYYGTERTIKSGDTALKWHIPDEKDVNDGIYWKYMPLYELEADGNTTVFEAEWKYIG